MSLIEAFTTVASDGAAVVPTYEAIVKHVRETYLAKGESSAKEAVDNPHLKRRRHIEERLRWYRDEYLEDVYVLVDLIYDNAKNRKQRKKLAELAMSMNTSARVVDEISSIYERPAERIFTDSEATQKAWDELAADLDLDETLDQAARLLNLCNEILLWSPERKGMDRDVEVITPDAFDAIPDPRRTTAMAGLLLDAAPVTLSTGAMRERLKHYELWDDEVVIALDANGRMIGPPLKHGLGRIPGILVHRRKPAPGRLLDAHAGRDILAAHKAVVFLNLCIVRLSKSQGERQPVLQGMLSRVAKNQAMDGETPIALPPEVTLDMLDSKTDPEHFLKTIKHFIAGVAQRYGMSYEQFTFQETADTASGKAYQVRRQKLTELRHAQAKRWRRAEPALVELLGFPIEHLHVDFWDPGMPQDPAEENQLLRERMKLGLDNPIAYLRRKDPDLSAKAAWRIFQSNIRINAEVYKALRALNLPADADAENPGRSPEENGALARQGNNGSPTPGVSGGPTATRAATADMATTA